jgi:two-component system sensor histidine kinase/response regulator
MEQPLAMLLVEDNPGDARLFSLALDKVDAARFALTHVRTLAEARTALTARRFELVMLDLSLPDSSGLETVKEILSIDRTLAVVVLTGTDDETTALQAVQLGAQDYLQKGDFTSQTLFRAMLHAIERNRMRRELEQLSRDKDKLLSIISHDLKSPFYSMVQVVKYIADNFDSLDPRTIRSHLGVIAESTEKLYELVENLLQWAGSQAGRIELHPIEFELGPLVESVIDVYREAAAQKRITVVNLTGDRFTGYADMNMIHTVLRNLVSNGIKFTGQDGAVTITAVEAGDTVSVTVSDTGIGISPERLQTLFHAENRSVMPGTAGEQGTGLGLMVCREFMRKNRGEISVDSEEGRGTAFTFTLPRTAPTAEFDATGSHAADPHTAGSRVFRS